MRNGRNVEWCVNLCEANKKMLKSSGEEIKRIVREYPAVRRFTDVLLGKTDYSAAEYNMASRFVKKDIYGNTFRHTA